MLSPIRHYCLARQSAQSTSLLEITQTGLYDFHYVYKLDSVVVWLQLSATTDNTRSFLDRDVVQYVQNNVPGGRRSANTITNIKIKLRH